MEPLGNGFDLFEFGLISKFLRAASRRRRSLSDRVVIRQPCVARFPSRRKTLSSKPSRHSSLRSALFQVFICTKPCVALGTASRPDTRDPTFFVLLPAAINQSTTSTSAFFSRYPTPVASVSVSVHDVPAWAIRCERVAWFSAVPDA